MVQVKKRVFASWCEAIDFTSQKLSEGFANIRIITSKSRLAERYKIVGEQVQVRYW